MKVLLLLTIVAIASASVIPVQQGWRKAKPRDMSKYKPMDKTLPVTPNPHLNIRKTLKKLLHKNKPVVNQALPPTKSFADECGQMNKNSDRIVGGEQAQPHQFPWQVGVFLDGAYFCGGSIISDEYILTAAHCVDGFSFWDVVIGAHEIRNPSEEGHLEVTTTTSFIHPNWDDWDLSNDVAILKVPKITFNEFASPICLPTRDQVGETFVGETMTVSGWGRESDASSSIARFLNFVSRPIITNAECNAVYGIVGSGVICIDTTGGKGTCNGDSGGPLVMAPEGQTTYTQYGVVSFGASAGCEVGYPAGFTRVTEYLDFISDNTGIIIN